MECDSTEVSIDGNLAMFSLLCICIKSRLVGDVVLPCDNRTVGQHATGFGDKSSDLAENIVEQRRNQLRNVFATLLCQPV